MTYRHDDDGRSLATSGIYFFFALLLCVCICSLFVTCFDVFLLLALWTFFFFFFFYIPFCSLDTFFVVQIGISLQTARIRHSYPPTIPALPILIKNHHSRHSCTHTFPLLILSSTSCIFKYTRHTSRAAFFLGRSAYLPPLYVLLGSKKSIKK